MMREFNPNNITSIERLDYNWGGSHYLGILAQQNHNTYEVFYNFLNSTKPKRILEIGTGVGGFIYALKSLSIDLDMDIDIITFDVLDYGMTQNLRNSNIDARLGNIFDADYTKIPQEIINYIQKDGVSVVLCDGINKVAEFKLLSQFIKTGDFIFAHDYSSTSQYFMENIFKKIWNWHEIDDSKINESVVKHNLLPYMKEEFEQVVWVCKIKS